MTTAPIASLYHVPQPTAPNEPDAQTKEFYVNVMRILDDARLPYVVGGGYAMAYYTGIRRNTKDLDLFVKPEDKDRCLTTCMAAGYRSEFFFPFWIAKAINPANEAFVDILYNSGNGLCRVDDEWMSHSVEHEVLGYRTRLVPAEEQLWSKAFVQDRDRFDGADVAHLIYARSHQFDWARLLRRFAGHEGVLLAHLVLFRYVYPTERRRVPDWVYDRLIEATRDEPIPAERICRGTFIAQKPFLPDVQQYGLVDARLQPYGPLEPHERDQLPQDHQ